MKWSQHCVCRTSHASEFIIKTVGFGFWIQEAYGHNTPVRMSAPSPGVGRCLNFAHADTTNRGWAKFAKRRRYVSLLLANFAQMQLKQLWRIACAACKTFCPYSWEAPANVMSSLESMDVPLLSLVNDLYTQVEEFSVITKARSQCFAIKIALFSIEAVPWFEGLC